MECISASDLEAFITYAYTGEITLTDDNALSLLETANYLGEDGIKKACSEFLENYMKTEDSFRVYHLTKSIGCLSLKNAVKSRIMSRFESVSQSSEYLDLDFESLSDILSDGKAQPVGTQRIFFEGTMQWILHDAKKRRNRINDLLSFIDPSKLPMDYFVKYLGNLRSRTGYDSGIVVNGLKCWYYDTGSDSEPVTKKPRLAHSEQALTILGRSGSTLSFQTYNFAERKWSQPQSIRIISKKYYSSCAVWDDKFYFLFEESGSCCLNMFDPSTKLSRILNSSNSILKGAALCACNRFVYLCGGRREDNSKSDQVLRYDPQANSFESLPPMPTRRSAATAIFYRGCLHVVGGFGSLTNTVEKYDPGAKKWMGLPTMCEPRYYHQVAVLDEKLYACGGDDTDSVEVYDPAKNSWQCVASMNKKRSCFTLVAHEGKLLAIGGEGKRSIEVYDPGKDQWQRAKMSPGLRLDLNMAGFISSC